ncbi:glutathione S-transferase family protein [Haliangium ochraceum]|uniref:Glutathione S-transferase domain protein n=1 Tax=Haliangium ochraceum (strain DSM 14365 / JCM 11303 / SMP-2) TaxID=502025 RepID=D0LUJ1_HALO1|nr:glutathione S-transferase family protein [Haliangium ochraceum]ACY19314.1 Glutathione S-transferase domain protein [Haliangium ochraceum DSM 14365]
MIKIHGAHISPFVRKACLVLLEKGIPYEVSMVNPFAPPDDFRKLSPLGKVPVLQDEFVTLADSSCIAAYIERRFPEPALYPESPSDYGRALFYEEYADTQLAMTLGQAFIHRVIKPIILKQEGDEQAVQASLTKVPAIFDYLSDELGDREFITGDRVSVADLAIATHFVSWIYSRVSLDAERWPKLAAYVQRMHARPSFQTVLAQEKALIEGA